MTYRQSVFKRYHSDKHFLEFYQQDGGKHQLAEICNDNYVTVTHVWPWLGSPLAA